MSTLLIVSTDSPTATLLGAFAEVEGYDVEIHDDARETPEATIGRARPHLILIDIDHPDDDHAADRPRSICYRPDAGTPLNCLCTAELLAR